jgi:hypothetical protein
MDVSLSIVLGASTKLALLDSLASLLDAMVKGLPIF